ncbi:MAG TPA: hypothetical protein VF335_08230, partial [Chitinivibrionales bacterium]
MWTVVVMLCLPCGYAKENQKDEWQTRENRVTRLGGEWYKIQVLMHELHNMQQILQDVQDIELFPSELTRLGDESLIALDKKIDVVMKKHQALVQHVESLRPPLIDAMAILREMVTGQPVEEMFQVLDNDDIHRISDMFIVKHHIDSLWRDFDGLFSGLSTMVQMRQGAEEEIRPGFESEFFEILKASLGKQSERYYAILNTLKDTLYRRGNEDLRERMFQVESHRIKGYLKSGNADLANMKLPAISARYNQSKFTTECTLLQVKTDFALGEFDQVLQTVQKLPDSIARLPEVVSDKIRSLYILKRFDELLQCVDGIDLRAISAGSRNFIVWLALESALATKKTEQITAR